MNEIKAHAQQLCDVLSFRWNLYGHPEVVAHTQPFIGYTGSSSTESMFHPNSRVTLPSPMTTRAEPRIRCSDLPADVGERAALPIDSVPAMESLRKPSTN